MWCIQRFACSPIHIICKIIPCIYFSFSSLIIVPDIPFVAACGQSETEAIANCQQRLCCELYELLLVGERPFSSSYEIISAECERDKNKFLSHSNWKVIRVSGKPICMRLSEHELDAERLLARKVEQEVLNKLSIVDRIWLTGLQAFRTTRRATSWLIRKLTASLSCKGNLRIFR